MFWFDDSDGTGLKLGPITVCKTYDHFVGYWYLSVLGQTIYDGWRRYHV